MLLFGFSLSFSAITMAGSIGTNVATGAGAPAGGQAGGFTGFPIGVGGGGGTHAGNDTRMSPQQIQQYMMGQLGDVGLPQGRPTRGTGFNYGHAKNAPAAMGMKPQQ